MDDSVKNVNTKNKESKSTRGFILFITILLIIFIIILIIILVLNLFNNSSTNIVNNPNLPNCESIVDINSLVELNVIDNPCCCQGSALNPARTINNYLSNNTLIITSTPYRNAAQVCSSLCDGNFDGTNINTCGSPASINNYQICIDDFTPVNCNGLILPVAYDELGRLYYPYQYGICSNQYDCNIDNKQHQCLVF
jgi:hypothetical protein